MTRSQICRRWMARIDRDQHGFTIIEVIAALGIMLTLLVSLAYVVTSGLAYQRDARMRQTGNALANRMMEQIRGLPYESITEGMLSTDLGGDTNVVSCPGSIKRLFACDAVGTSFPGTAEEIVASDGLGTVMPLVPHRSSTAPNANETIDGVSYTWSTYVSQAEPDVEDDEAPYRVTVQVGWTGLGGGAEKVRIQSLFWSPIGCRSTATHPYAAPCQAFFYGTATVPAGQISIDPTPSSSGLVGTEFTGADLALAGVNASIQQEQVVQGLANLAVPHVDLSTSGVATTYGAAQGAASADSDPNTSSTDYQRVRCGTEVTCAAPGSSPSSPSGAASDRISFGLQSTSTAESVASTTSATLNPCPPANVATAENDAISCAGASYVQPGDITSSLTIGSGASLGTFDLVRVAPSGATDPAPFRALADRVSAPTTNTCTPVADTDGCLKLSAARAFGTIGIGGLPSGFGTPTGWQGAFARITGYADSATATVGSGSTFPTTSATPPSGQLEIYNGTTGYESFALNGTSIAGTTRTFTRVQTYTTGSGDRAVTITFTLDGTQSTNASVLKSGVPSGTGTVEGRTEANAEVAAPIVVVRVQISIEGVTGNPIVDLTTTVNLGTLDLSASYVPEPAVGS